jgi:glycosyltransferase involved in cell wall biosynthesis
MSFKKIRVAALTRGKNAPSSRFRVRQLIPTLQGLGVDIHEFIPFVASYPPPQHWLRPLWFSALLSVRIPAVIATNVYDIALLQRELVSTFLTLEPLIKHPLVFDVDDAIFLHKRGWIAKKIAQLSDLVICGNDYIADTFYKWNKNMAIIPTAVDTTRFVPAIKKEDEKKLIGWIGTSSNLTYLLTIERALSRVLDSCSDVQLRIVSDFAPKFQTLSKTKVEFIKWSPEVEVKCIQEMSIGIMPLEDTNWARGKCSYKMLQYMSCGIPVVVSPVGMNSRLLSIGNVGIAANNNKDWEEGLFELLSSPKKRELMGKMGRKIANDHFSINRIASLLSDCLRTFCT